jgi:hypothetical protein
VIRTVQVVLAEVVGTAGRVRRKTAPWQRRRQWCVPHVELGFVDREDVRVGERVGEVWLLLLLTSVVSVARGTRRRRSPTSGTTTWPGLDVNSGDVHVQLRAALGSVK